MMYQALTGKLPHEAPSVPALLFAIVEKSPASLRDARPDVPAELAAIVERAMAKDRNARFSDAEEMRRALAPWSGLPASIPPPVSATAATLVGASTPLPEATPIVVHRTPAPNAPETKKADEQPPKRSLAAMIMITVVAIVGVLVLGAVVIVSMVVKARDQGARRDVPAVAASSVAPAQTIAQQAISSAASSVAAPLAPPSASASLAGAVPVQHRYSGSHGFVGGSDFGECSKCDWETFRNDMGMKVAEISACFNASIHEPPKHETIYYKVGVTASGDYTTFEVQGDEKIPARLDRCLTGVITRTPLRKPGGDAGSFKIGFRSECPKWAPPDTLKWCPD